MSNKVYEAENYVPIYDTCDILVVGGGAAGHSAAIAAARAGAKNIILMERYGYMGGDVTGGYVIMVPNLSWYNKSFVRGLQEEWFTRLDKIPGAVLGPGLDKIGWTDKIYVNQWKAIHDCTSRDSEGSKETCLVRSVYYEPNQLKIEMDKMLLEHKDSIKVLLHSWGVKPIMEGNEIKGVFFESKEGRQAVMAKVVIDATGDGDLFSQAGAPCEKFGDIGCRSNATALVWRIGGIDWNAYTQWLRSTPGSFPMIVQGLQKIAGYKTMPLPSNQNDICWLNNWFYERDCSCIEDITKTEMEVRDSIRDIIEFFRETVPVAFKNAFLYDIAPQLGTRCSRRLVGEYVMSIKDFAFATKHDDVIAWHSTICQINDCGPVEIPYRAIMPQKIENMLCPGRHLSADNAAIDWLNLIPQCVGTGQAAGVAAAVAVADGTTVRNVDIKKVQDILVDQDVPLPRNEKFRAKDPSYEALVEEKEYGLYTALAKKAREEGIDSYRQW